MHHSTPSFLLSYMAITASALTTGIAHAKSGFTLAAEVGADVVVSDLTDDTTLHSVGPAVALRFGYSFAGPLVRLTPEAKLAFESPGTPEAAAFMGGARLNLLGVVSPAVFAHAGGLVGDISGFVWDAGVGLDLSIVPLIDVGVYGAFFQTRGASFGFGNVTFSNRETYEWLQFGVQLALHF